MILYSNFSMSATDDPLLDLSLPCLRFPFDLKNTTVTALSQRYLDQAPKLLTPLSSLFPVPTPEDITLYLHTSSASLSVRYLDQEPNVLTPLSSLFPVPTPEDIALYRVYTTYGTVHTREWPPQSHSTEHTHIPPNTHTLGVYRVHTRNMIRAHSASSAAPHPPSKQGRPERKITLKLLKIYHLYRIINHP